MDGDNWRQFNYGLRGCALCQPKILTSTVDKAGSSPATPFIARIATSELAR